MAITTIAVIQTATGHVLNMIRADMASAYLNPNGTFLAGIPNGLPVNQSWTYNASTGFVQQGRLAPLTRVEILYQARPLYISMIVPH
jgi:hypothetical protein